MPVELLIYITIAVVLVVWLRNTIGTRNGSEVDRSDILEQLRQRQLAQKDDSTGNVIDLTVGSATDEKATSNAKLDGVAIEGGADTAKDVIEFIKSDPSFDPRAFVSGARDAFPMIVEAFAKGDLKTLKMLLSDGVFATFEQAIEDRNVRGETLVTDVHAVRDCRILGIKRIDRMIYIKVRIIAEESLVTRDREGSVISGHPDKIITMNDVWTFGRDSRSKDPTWYLYETSDDVLDELKNPVPDAKQ